MSKKIYQTLTALPSPDDYHDQVYEISQEKSINQKLPLSLDYRPDLLSIQDQDSTPLCLAMAGACIKEWQERKNINFQKHMSAQFLYNLRTSGHQGMTGRDLLSILKHKGILPEQLYPQGTKENIVDNQYLTRAKQFRIKSYARILSIIGLKRALCENGPALMLMPVFSITENDFWKPKKPNQLRLGGQSLVVVGYDKKGFWLRNSWGSSYGQNGYVLYPYSDWGYHWEVWTMVDHNNLFQGLDFEFDFDFHKQSKKNEKSIPDPEIEINYDIDPDSIELLIENQDNEECPICLEEESTSKKVLFKSDYKESE